MRRWMAGLFVGVFLFSSAHATLDRAARPTGSRLLPLKSLSSSSASSAKDDEFRITPNTVVLLDGRPCRYEKIPDGATIVLLETVTNESKEISRIHFRSPRRPAASSSK